MRHSLPTRLLHLLLATAILAQLATSQLMRTPRPGRVRTPLESAGFAVHEWVGLAAMAILLAFWLWLTLRRLGTAPGQLFPWFSRTRLLELRQDALRYLQAARRLSLPEPEQGEAVAAVLHGLGLLIALAMATTGTLGWLSWDQAAGMDGFARAVFEVHGTLANLMWAYVIAHVGAAILHELLGHRLLRRMSPFTP